MDIAFIDIETTGLDPARHEVIEVAAVRVDWTTLRPIDAATTKIRPAHIETAVPRALEVNGYSEAAWAEAVELAEGLSLIAPVIGRAMLAGHNVDSFDWPFLRRAYASAGLPVPEVDYHRLDTASLAWLLADAEGDSVSLDAACRSLGVERPNPHRALADAMASLEVARRIRRLVGPELTLAQVAQLLRISPKTAYTMARDAQLPAFRVGAQWRMRRADLNDWISTQIRQNAEASGGQ